MKEITRIHLAKTPYSVELDAKKALEEYLLAIEKTMKADEDALREIEARMVELLEVRGVMSDQVISLSDVESLREQMGEPKEFSEDGESVVEEKTAIHEADEKPTKRFMRDTDNAVIGGVCAGVAAYFNKDVLLIRLVMVALAIMSFGTILLIYLIFWISTPPARTKADRLVMAGKPVTLEALKESSDSTGVRPPSLAFKRFFRLGLGVVMLMATLGTVVGVMVGGFVGYDLVSTLKGLSAQPWAFGMLASLFIGGVALITLLGLLTSAAFRWSVRKAAGLAMLAMLLVGAFATAGVAISATQTMASLARDEKNYSKTEAVELPTNLDGIKGFEVVGEATLDMRASDTPRAEVKYWAVGDHSKPNVKIERVGDILRFVVDKDHQGESCSSIIVSNGSCEIFYPNITLYGVDAADRVQSLDEVETKVSTPSSNQ